MANKLLINEVLEYLLFAVFPFPFFKAFECMFCYYFLYFSISARGGGFIKNMNTGILLGDILLMFFYILFKNNLVKNIFFSW